MIHRATPTTATTTTSTATATTGNRPPPTTAAEQSQLTLSSELLGPSSSAEETAQGLAGSSLHPLMDIADLKYLDELRDLSNYRNGRDCSSSQSPVKIIDIQRTNKNKPQDEETALLDEDERRRGRNSALSQGSSSSANKQAFWNNNQQQRQSAALDKSSTSNNRPPDGETLSSFESDYDLLVYLGETETEDIVDTERSIDYQDQTWRQSICGGASLAPTIDDSLSELLITTSQAGELNTINNNYSNQTLSPASGSHAKASNSSSQRDLFDLTAGSASLPRRRYQHQQQAPLQVNNPNQYSSSLSRVRNSQQQPGEAVEMVPRHREYAQHQRPMGGKSSTEPQDAAELDRLLAEMSQSLDLDSLARYDPYKHNKSLQQPSNPTTTTKMVRTTANRVTDQPPSGQSQRTARSNVTHDDPSKQRAGHQHQGQHQISNDSILDEYDGASRMLEEMLSGSSSISNSNKAITKTNTRTLPRELHASYGSWSAPNSMMSQSVQNVELIKGAQSGPAERVKPSSESHYQKSSMLANQMSDKISNQSSSEATGTSVISNLKAKTTTVATTMGDRKNIKYTPNTMQSRSLDVVESRELFFPDVMAAKNGFDRAEERQQSDSPPPPPPEVDYSDHEGGVGVINVEAADMPTSSSSSNESDDELEANKSKRNRNKHAKLMMDKMKRRTMSSMRSMRSKFNDFIQPPELRSHKPPTNDSAPLPAGRQPKPPERSSSFGSNSNARPNSKEPSEEIEERRSRQRTKRVAPQPQQQQQQHPKDRFAEKSFGQQLRERLSRSRSRLSKFFNPSAETDRTDTKSRRAQSTPDKQRHENSSGHSSVEATTPMFQPSDISRNSPITSQRKFEESLDRHVKASLNGQQRAAGKKSSSSSSDLSGLDVSGKANGKSPIRSRRDRDRLNGSKTEKDQEGNKALLSIKRLSNSFKKSDPASGTVHTRVEMGPKVRLASDMADEALESIVPRSAHHKRKVPARSQSLRSARNAQIFSLEDGNRTGSQGEDDEDARSGSSKADKRPTAQKAVSFSNLTSSSFIANKNGVANQRRLLSPEVNSFRPTSTCGNAKSDTLMPPQTSVSTRSAPTTPQPSGQDADYHLAPISPAPASPRPGDCPETSTRVISDKSPRATSPLDLKTPAKKIIHDIRAKCGELFSGNPSVSSLSSSRAGHHNKPPKSGPERAPIRPPRRNAKRVPEEPLEFFQNVSSANSEVAPCTTSKWATMHSIEEPVDSQQLCQWRPVIATSTNKSRGAKVGSPNSRPHTQNDKLEERLLQRQKEQHQRSIDTDSTWESSDSEEERRGLNEDELDRDDIKHDAVVRQQTVSCTTPKANESLVSVGITRGGAASEQQVSALGEAHSHSQIGGPGSSSGSKRSSHSHSRSHKPGETAANKLAWRGANDDNDAKRNANKPPPAVVGDQNNNTSATITTSSGHPTTGIALTEKSELKERQMRTQSIEPIQQANLLDEKNVERMQVERQQNKREYGVRETPKPKHEQQTICNTTFKFNTKLPPSTPPRHIGTVSKNEVTSTKSLAQQQQQRLEVEEAEATGPQAAKSQNEDEIVNGETNRLSVYENVDARAGEPVVGTGEFGGWRDSVASAADWSIDGSDQQLALERKVAKKAPEAATIETTNAPDKIGQQDGRGQDDKAAVRRVQRKLVTMTSIIQEPEDELMTTSVQRSSRSPVEKQSECDELGGFSQTAPLGECVSESNNSDSDSSRATAAANRRQLVDRLAANKTTETAKQKPPLLPRPKNLKMWSPSGGGGGGGQQASSGAPATTARGPMGGSGGGSLVRRLAKNFDQTAAAVASGSGQQQQQQQSRTPLKTVTSVEENEPQSDSTWYDAKSVELLDEAEVAELLREFDDEVGAPSSGDPYVSVGESTISFGRKDARPQGVDEDDDDTLNDGDDRDLVADTDSDGASESVYASASLGKGNNCENLKCSATRAPPLPISNPATSDNVMLPERTRDEHATPPLPLATSAVVGSASAYATSGGGGGDSGGVSEMSKCLPPAAPTKSPQEEEEKEEANCPGQSISMTLTTSETATTATKASIVMNQKPDHLNDHNHHRDHQLPEEEEEQQQQKQQQPPSPDALVSGNQQQDEEEEEFDSDDDELSTLAGDRVSLSSSSISAESIPELRQRQNLQKLYHIVNEIYSSEAKFVETLQMLNVDFRNHIFQGSQQASGNPPPNQQQQLQQPYESVSSILKYLPQLQALNENLLEELKLARDQWPKTQKISHVLVKIGPFLKHYSSYIREFESNQQQFHENLKKYPQFAEKVRAFEADERKCQKLNIQHHLMKPIQRIPQYRLLLQQYLHYLKPDDLDYEDTVNALEVVSRVAEHANQSMNEGINFAKLLALQAKIVASKRRLMSSGRSKSQDLVQPGRLFLKEGELMKVCRKQIQPKYFVLLSDSLLYLTQIQSSDLLYLNYELPLEDCQVTTPSEAKQTSNLIGHQFETEFSVCTPIRSFSLIAKSRQERDEWVAALRQAIEDFLSRRRSFRALRDCAPQKSETEDQEQLNELLGRKAPLWTPDARVSMCQLCTSDFSALFRRHHCRSCGKVVCSACSSNKAPLIYLKCRAARVCDQCFQSLKANIHLYYLNANRSSLRLQNSNDGGSGGGGGGGGNPNDEKELRRLDEHFSTLLKCQFMRHVGLDKLRAQSKQQQGSSSSSSDNSNSHNNNNKNNHLRPLKEVGANDKGSTISGYLHQRHIRAHNRKAKWKLQWFVIKDKVLYAFRAIDDVAAVSSIPLLGFSVDQPGEPIDGLEPRSLVRLRHCSGPKLSQDNSNATSELEGVVMIEHLFKAESFGAAERWLDAFKKSVLLDEEIND